MKIALVFTTAVCQYSLLLNQSLAQRKLAVAQSNRPSSVRALARSLEARAAPGAASRPPLREPCGQTRAKEWVGKPIAETVRLDLDDKTVTAKVKGLLKIWIKNGMFKIVDGQDEEPKKIRRGRRLGNLKTRNVRNAAP